ncbi:phosphomannomutase/phosphoglucomutase, partial [Promicromonospora sp. NPDC090134]
WFNLRASNTEPLLRLNVEAADQDIMEKVRDDVLSLVRDPADEPAEGEEAP